VRAAGEPPEHAEGGDERQHDLLRGPGDDSHRQCRVAHPERGLRRDRRQPGLQVRGPGTRANLDEFTYTTSGAIEKVGGARKGKALAIINPAEPPMIMRNTISCLTDDEPDHVITESILQMIKEVQKYVPGYRLVNGPIYDGNKVQVFMEVAGLGDYLPRYAGNLDIMTAAAARTAEMFAEEILAGRIQLNAVEIA
jgi:acetaldehyde/propanal dehydrogenase